MHFKTQPQKWTRISCETWMICFTRFSVLLIQFGLKTFTFVCFTSKPGINHTPVKTIMWNPMHILRPKRLQNHTLVAEHDPPLGGGIWLPGRPHKQHPTLTPFASLGLPKGWVVIVQYLELRLLSILHKISETERLLVLVGGWLSSTLNHLTI